MIYRNVYTLHEITKYQIQFTWIASDNIFFSFHIDYNAEFHFLNLNLTFRCKIPECESNAIEYNPNWLINTIPFENKIPSKCNRFKYNHYDGSENVSTVCPAVYFNQSIIEKCNEFVYKTDEETILSEVIITISHD